MVGRLTRFPFSTKQELLAVFDLRSPSAVSSILLKPSADSGKKLPGAVVDLCTALCILQNVPYTKAVFDALQNRVVHVLALPADGDDGVNTPVLKFSTSAEVFDSLADQPRGSTQSRQYGMKSG